MALNDFRDAVKLLLNQDPNFFSLVINELTKERFLAQMGQINDFTKPICDEFQIERRCVDEIDGLFYGGAKLVGVVGPAFSGKTNLMYQFFRRMTAKESFVFYLDCHDHNYSIFKQLSNHFLTAARLLITKEQVWEWLINSVNEQGDHHLYLLIDNFNAEIPEIIKDEIIELVDIFRGGGRRILYTIDEFNYEKWSKVDSREYRTVIGRESKIVKLHELDDTEYFACSKLMFDKFRVAIGHGGLYSQEYRQPRILRYLLSQHLEGIEEGRYAKIDAVPDLSFLYSVAANRAFNQKVNTLYKKILECFLTEEGIPKKSDPELNIMASGSGAIKLETFLAKFPADVESLFGSSVLVLRKTPTGKEVIYPKLPELVAKHAIPVVAKTLAIQAREGKSAAELIRFLTETVSSMPLCDIVATGILVEIGRTDESPLLFDLINHLLSIPPSFEQLRGGASLLMYSEDRGHIQMELEGKTDDAEGGFIDNFLPYAILSQFAAYPLRLMDYETGSESAFHLHLLYTVGSNKELLRRADPISIRNFRELEGYTLEGVGFLISGKVGIIEPIVQSIQKCFTYMPDEVLMLCDRAFAENNVIFLQRAYLAIREFESSMDEELVAKAAGFVTKYTPFLKQFLPKLSYKK